MRRARSSPERSDAASRPAAGGPVPFIAVSETTLTARHLSDLAHRSGIFHGRRHLLDHATTSWRLHSAHLPPSRPLMRARRGACVLVDAYSTGHALDGAFRGYVFE